jgi:hypothetical protein
MDQRCPSEKESYQGERDCRSQPGVNDVLVQLTIHCRAAALERASEDDKWDDPSRIRIHKISFVV